MVNIGLIGFGYWGRNLARNLNTLNSAKLIECADLEDRNRAEIIRLYNLPVVTNMYESILDDDKIDAVVIATPVSTHYKIALDALNNNKHVLIEKPMCSTAKEAKKLIELANKHERVLMVDHTFIYSGAVQKLRELVQSGELGMIEYIDSTRINLGLFQSDINVAWDLAPHDISIVNYILDGKPCRVSAKGTRLKNENLESIAHLYLDYGQTELAHYLTKCHIHVNWLSPVKIRQMIIGGDEKMAIYNDLEPDEKVKVYNHGADIDLKTSKIAYRTGDIYIPKLDRTEPLKRMCEHFIDCIKYGDKCLSGGEQGLEVVEVLEAAQRSLNNGGQEITV